MLAEIFGIDALVLLLIVVALVGGGLLLPKLARSIGSAKGAFTSGLKHGTETASELPAAPAEPAPGR